MKRGLATWGIFIMALAVVAPAAAADPLLVDTRWLEARRADRSLRLVDMVSETADYRRAHIPGAVYLHVNDSRIAVRAGGYRLPTEAEAARLFGALGIGPDTFVVVYDDAGGLHASRLFFTLEVFGHRRVAILDGGIQAWQRAGLPLTAERPTVSPADYRPALRPERVASADWLRTRLGDPAFAIVDARTPAEYHGTELRARRGGHIPGAINIDWRRHLKPDGTFKPMPELRLMYLAAGATPDKTVVTYCQTHHRASHSYFVLRLLGYPALIGYDRSWAEWGDREDLPVASPSRGPVHPPR